MHDIRSRSFEKEGYPTDSEGHRPATKRGGKATPK
jgi:hypothetical protein